MIEKAIAFAATMHAEQLDKAGLPYIYHPLRVMQNVLHLGEDYAVAAVLHDVLEDTKATMQDLVDLGVLGNVRVAVAALTHTRGEPYLQYVGRANMNRIAKPVKVADIMDNMSRMEHILDRTKVDAMRRKYLLGMQVLAA